MVKYEWYFWRIGLKINQTHDTAATLIMQGRALLACLYKSIRELIILLRVVWNYIYDAGFDLFVKMNIQN